MLEFTLDAKWIGNVGSPMVIYIREHSGIKILVNLINSTISQSLLIRKGWGDTIHLALVIARG